MRTDQELAVATKEAMFKNDFKAQELGIDIVEIKPGYARATMTVTKSMLNGHGSTHGGTTFSLADTAFAYACNTHNKVTVAAGCDITFSAPSYEGDTLTAEAKETLLNGRSGIYDVTITRGDGEVVALFRGRSRTIKGEVIKND